MQQKILFTITYYTPNISGMTSYLATLSKELVAQGQSCTIMTSQFKKDLPLEENIDQVKVIRQPVSFFVGKGPIMLSLWIEAWNAVRKNDIINCHLPQFEAIIYALYAKILRKKLIVSYQAELSFRGGIVNRISSFIVYVFQQIVLLLADQILVLTEDYAMSRRALNPYHKKLKFLIPPVDISNLVEENISEEYQEFLNQHKNDQIIGFLGRIAQQKGLEYLIKAFDDILQTRPNTCLALIGPYQEVIGESHLNELEKLLQTNRDRIFIAGKVLEQAKGNYFKTLDVFVIPSADTQESLAISQIEAMCFGVPVVVTDLAGVRVPVQMTKMGLIAKRADALDLSEKIKQVLADKKVFIKPQNEICAIFAVDKIAQKFIQIITQ